MSIQEEIDFIDMTMAEPLPERAREWLLIRRKALIALIVKAGRESVVCH